MVLERCPRQKQRIFFPSIQTPRHVAPRAAPERDGARRVAAPRAVAPHLSLPPRPVAPHVSLPPPPRRTGPPAAGEEASRTFTPSLAPSPPLAPSVLKAPLPTASSRHRTTAPPPTSPSNRELRLAELFVRTPASEREGGGGGEEDVFPAAAEGARVGLGRRGGGAGSEAAVPDDAGEPAAAVGLHPEGLHHPLHPAAAHRRRRLRRRVRPPRRALLRILPRRLRPLHLPHHPPLHRAVSPVLLLSAPPGEPAASWSLHRRHQLRRRPLLRLHQRGGDPGVGDPDGGGGGEPDGVHLLGGEARARLQLPGPVPVRGVDDPDGVRAHPALLPARQDLSDDLRRAGGAHLLRLHRLRHRQPHQALLLRRVRLGRRRALPRRHQPLPLPPHALQGIRFLKNRAALPSLASIDHLLSDDCALLLLVRIANL